MKIVLYFNTPAAHAGSAPVYYRTARAVGEGAERYGRYMCAVLNAVAQSQQDCDQLIGYLDAVAYGSQPMVETGGNDVTLTITPAGVHVDIEVIPEWIDQPEANFTIDEWRRVLQAWKRFLRMEESADARLEVEL